MLLKLTLWHRLFTCTCFITYSTQLICFLEGICLNICLCGWVRDQKRNMGVRLKKQTKNPPESTDGSALDSFAAFCFLWLSQCCRSVFAFSRVITKTARRNGRLYSPLTRLILLLLHHSSISSSSTFSSSCSGLCQLIFREMPEGEKERGKIGEMKLVFWVSWRIFLLLSWDYQ